MDIETINNLMSRYGHVVNIEKNIETFPVGGFGLNFPSAMYGRISIDMNIRFHDTTGIVNLFEDLEAGRKAKAEEELRKKNPSVQQAWEEYQLLLKLS